MKPKKKYIVEIIDEASFITNEQLKKIQKALPRIKRLVKRRGGNFID